MREEQERLKNRQADLERLRRLQMEQMNGKNGNGNRSQFDDYDGYGDGRNGKGRNGDGSGRKGEFDEFAVGYRHPNETSKLRDDHLLSEHEHDSNNYLLNNDNNNNNNYNNNTDDFDKSYSLYNNHNNNHLIDHRSSKSPIAGNPSLFDEEDAQKLSDPIFTSNHKRTILGSINNTDKFNSIFLTVYQEL